jgi:hypothetical protein
MARLRVAIPPHMAQEPHTLPQPVAHARTRTAAVPHLCVPYLLADVLSCMDKPANPVGPAPLAVPFLTHAYGRPSPFLLSQLGVIKT